jgi:hypothetical protein
VPILDVTILATLSSVPPSAEDMNDGGGSPVAAPAEPAST